MGESSSGEQINYNQNLLDRRTAAPSDALQERQMTLEAGVLGRFFGSASRAPTSIAGIIALLLTSTLSNYAA